MTEAQGDGVSRRNFLKVATLTAVAAAATGGGAALLKRGDSPVTITTAPNVPPANTAAPLATTAPVISDIIPAVSASGDDLMARLAAAQTENMQLRAANDQLLRDLAALQTAEQDGRVARDSMTLELDNARNQLGILGGLVALYQQLDDVDMGDLVENGLGAVGEKVGELLGGTPALAAGLDAGQLALGVAGARQPDARAGARAEQGTGGQYRREGQRRALRCQSHEATVQAVGVAGTRVSYDEFIAHAFGYA